MLLSQLYKVKGKLEEEKKSYIIALEKYNVEKSIFTPKILFTEHFKA